MVTYPSQWRVEDLPVGRVIFNPPMREVDPRTMKCTDTFARLIVTFNDGAEVKLAPYHGDKPGEMPPEHVGE